MEKLIQRLTGLLFIVLALLVIPSTGVSADKVSIGFSKEKTGDHYTVEVVGALVYLADERGNKPVVSGEQRSRMSDFGLPDNGWLQPIDIEGSGRLTAEGKDYSRLFNNDDLSATAFIGIEKSDKRRASERYQLVRGGGAEGKQYTIYGTEYLYDELLALTGISTETEYRLYASLVVSIGYTSGPFEHSGEVVAYIRTAAEFDTVTRDRHISWGNAKSHSKMFGVRAYC